MEYTINNSSSTVEVLLNGRLTFIDHDKFSKIIAAIREAQGEHTVLDLSGLEFADSSGLGMFIIAHDAAQKTRKSFSLRGARGDVRRMMALAKFEKRFAIHD